MFFDVTMYLLVVFINRNFCKNKFFRYD